MSKSIFEKTDITKADLDDLISNKIEESLNLDYKRGDGLINTEGVKKELAKDVSAFANSAGGLIIYGIEEIDHVPSGYHYVNGSQITKEWIEQVLQTRIHRKIPNLEIIPIRNNSKLEESIYVIKIPESVEAPHMTSDKRFYKRYNFESVKMEEYEIRNLYHKFQTTQFRLDDLIINKNTKTQKEDGNINLWIHATNIGKRYEDKYKLNIKCPQSIFVEKTRILAGSTKNLNVNIKYKGPAMELVSKDSETIFPNEKYQFGLVEILVTDIAQLEGQELVLTLTHTGGVVERKYKLDEIIKESDL